MELWDIYDKDRVKTGQTVVRGLPLGDSEYHMVVHICVFGADGKMLIQQRQPFKEGWPGLWDVTVGGSAVAGETSRQTAARELFEEIGLQCDFSPLTPFFTINAQQCFDDYYLIERDVDPASLRLQAEEVRQIKWAGREAIHSMIDSGEFIPYKKGLIDMLFEMKKCRGSHSV